MSNKLRDTVDGINEKAWDQEMSRPTTELLILGRIYDVRDLRGRFIGWTNPLGAVGYSVDAYFSNGRYLGPDEDGIEPLFSAC